MKYEIHSDAYLQAIATKEAYKKELLTSGYDVVSWNACDIATMHKSLEMPNWAPWLSATEATMQGRALVFPSGQLTLLHNEEIVASLSMNRINWNGDIALLPTWDDVAGIENTDYSETYMPDGNTLVLMSMNVVPSGKGKRYPSKLIGYTQLLANELGVEYLLGSFRPSGYGDAKLQSEIVLPFWQYCNMTQPDSDKPIDPWLRSLWWSGMSLLAEDDSAMDVIVSIEQFWEYQQTYKPEKWKQTAEDEWECGEVGTWLVTPTYAQYKESNAWGKLPLA